MVQFLDVEISMISKVLANIRAKVVEKVLTQN